MDAPFDQALCYSYIGCCFLCINMNFLIVISVRREVEIRPNTPTKPAVLSEPLHNFYNILHHGYGTVMPDWSSLSYFPEDK